MDRVGTPIAMHAATADAFSSRPVRDALDYVMHTLKNIFYKPDGGSSTIGAPVYRLFHHWTGIVLKLRGVRMLGSETSDEITLDEIERIGI
jgi:hypothetical protein